MDVASSGAVGQPPVAAHQPRARAAAGSRRPLGREVAALVLIALALTLLVRLLVVQAFYIPSASMEPTLAIGDRVLVSRLAYRVGEVQRGDVIVFDGRGSFTAADPVAAGGLARAAFSIGSFLGVSPSERDYVKRVVGLPGDRVTCCDTGGRLTVNRAPLSEPYVMAGDAASDVPFDVIVPPGRLWVMGDHRSDSADSRAHLGDPGGGTVPLERVVGEVVGRFWPLTALGRLPAAAGAAS